MSYAGFEKCLMVTELPGNDGQPLHVTPGDPGGATRRGLTLHIFSAWRVAHGFAPAAVSDLAAATEDEIETIFHAWFWNAVAGDRMPVGLDLILFEIGFLAGPRRAAQAVQRALGLEVSGRMDALTVGAAQAVRNVSVLLGQVADAFEAQAEHFGDAAEFERGWFARIHADVVTGLAWRVQLGGAT